MRVRNPVELLRSLSDKYHWKGMNSPHLPSYGLHSTTTVLLGGWLGFTASQTIGLFHAENVFVRYNLYAYSYLHSVLF